MFWGYQNDSTCSLKNYFFQKGVWFFHYPRWPEPERTHVPRRPCCIFGSTYYFLLFHTINQSTRKSSTAVILIPHNHSSPTWKARMNVRAVRRAASVHIVNGRLTCKPWITSSYLSIKEIEIEKKLSAGGSPIQPRGRMSASHWT